MNQPRISNAVLLQHIETAFREAYEQDPQAQDELLRDLGYDPQAAIERGMLKIKRIVAKQRLFFAQNAWEMFIGIAAQNKPKFETLEGNKLRSAVKDILQGRGNQLTLEAAFRDLQSIEDNDLRVIIKDTGLLDQLDEFLKMQ
ncbi:hypothetical protein KKH27_01210 [bacterium]|nr:hypothetical protein [bacterium]